VLPHIRTDNEFMGRRPASMPWPIRPTVGRWIAGLLCRLCPLVAECWRRFRSRRELLMLDDRELRDIGITRMEVFNETRKPFWQE
jgi:uncharacterized protein YjiS (DUF1127 family)